MKFKYLNSLNESEELWVSSKSAKEPASESKLAYCCNARPLKAMLKSLSDPKEIEDAINMYTKTNRVQYTGSVEYNGSTFYRFDPKDYGYDTFWYCKDYSNEYNINELKYNIPEGSILVADMGYSMTLYDFYRVEKYQGKSVIISKLEKIPLDNSFQPRVIPGDKVVARAKLRLTFPKNSMFSPSVSIGYHHYLHFDKNRLYDKSKTYQEDHLD